MGDDSPSAPGIISESVSHGSCRSESIFRVYYSSVMMLFVLELSWGRGGVVWAERPRQGSRYTSLWVRSTQESWNSAGYMIVYMLRVGPTADSQKSMEIPHSAAFRFRLLTTQDLENDVPNLRAGKHVDACKWFESFDIADVLFGPPFSGPADSATLRFYSPV